MSSNLLNDDLFIRTPLIESIQLNEFSPRKVLLKLENCQPSGSFKMRGISRLCQQSALNGCEEIICSSAGNAGLAAAASARLLGLKCRIFLPKTTPQMMKNMILREGADLVVCGQEWSDANDRAVEETQKSDKIVLIHPFNHPIIWSGHSTIIDELVEQLDTIPSMIITSCGGGGLTCGLIEGMRRHNWNSVPLLVMETIGADAFNLAIRGGSPIKPVRISSITSVAKSLGASAICQQLADDYNRGSPPILSHILDDRKAIEACIKFADQHRILVEPACGVSLAALYTGYISQLFEENRGEYTEGPVVVIVCGGATVTLDILKDYKNKFNL